MNWRNYGLSPVFKLPHACNCGQYLNWIMNNREEDVADCNSCKIRWIRYRPYASASRMGAETLSEHKAKLEAAARFRETVNKTIEGHNHPPLAQSG